MPGELIGGSAEYGMGVDGNTGLAPAKGRPPAVLQIVPRLGSGGAERGTGDIAGALVAPGWDSYVASGRAARDVARRRRGSSGPPDPSFRHRYRPCPQPRSGVERMVGGKRHRAAFRDNLSQRLRL